MKPNHVVAGPCLSAIASAKEDAGQHSPQRSGNECEVVILAAGHARRFGSPKLAMPFGENTILGSVVDAFISAGITSIVVVVGANADIIRESLGDRPIRIVVNPNPTADMISSIRVGVEALDAASRFLIALGDQPRIRPEDIRRLIDVHIKSGKGIAQPVYEGRRGHPIIFTAEYRQEILELTDQQTLRDIMATHSDDRIDVPCDSDAYLCDIDTREEYEQELRRLHGSP